MPVGEAFLDGPDRADHLIDAAGVEQAGVEVVGWPVVPEVEPEDIKALLVESGGA